MHRIMPTLRAMLLGAAAAAIFFTTTYAEINDSILSDGCIING